MKQILPLQKMPAAEKGLANKPANCKKAITAI
jgi:hypothetical protein